LDFQKYLEVRVNHPDFFAKEILSKDITPIKIGIEPADKKTCRTIITDVLTKVDKLPAEGMDTLVNAFFKNPDKYYSNGDIVTIITNTLGEFEHPLIRDYSEAIKRNDVPPSISKESLDKFYKTKKALEKL
jgi:hypothetical protein